MSTVLAKIAITILSYGVAIFIAVYFGALYNYFFPYASGGGFIGDPNTLSWMIGFPLAVIFLLTFLIHAQGVRHAWWWNSIALAPAILFEIVFDPTRIYFPIFIGFVAWGLGIIANKLFHKLSPSLMAKIR